MKVDRWAWQPDNRLSSCASVCGFSSFAPMFPMCHSPALFFLSLSFTPFPHTHTAYPIYYILQHLISDWFLYFTITPISPLPPLSILSTQCHNGPTLMEAFIKCQLYTRDHTVDTAISDPKRSMCLWPFSSCWRTVCQLCGLRRLLGISD